MNKPVIQAVCGFGIGSSMMLKIVIDEVLAENGLEAETMCSDLGTCLSNQCDVIFAARDIAESLEDRAEVKIVVIDNLMDKDEIGEKLKEFFADNKGE